VLILVCLVASLGGCATAGGTGPQAQTAALEPVLDEWAAAWSSSDVEKLLPLFTDDVRYEDVTVGAVNQEMHCAKNSGRGYSA
jgi:ketosteroid isomerase-like protein